MLSRYVNDPEEMPHYVSEDSQSHLEVVWKDHKFRYKDGHILHGDYLFVRLLDERLIATPNHPLLRHSFISRGANVLNAGILYTHHGQIITLSNNSGHYKPQKEQIDLLWENMSALCKNKNLVIEDHSLVDTEGVRFYNGGEYAKENDVPINLDQLTALLSANRLELMANEGEHGLEDEDGYVQCIDEVDPSRIPEDSANLLLLWTCFKGKESPTVSTRCSENGAKSTARTEAVPQTDQRLTHNLPQ